MTYRAKTAAGDPISDIIGAHIGDLEIESEKDLEIGFSLNPLKAVKSLSRAVKTVTNPLTRPIGRAASKIPLAKDAVNFTTQKANLFFTPARFLYGAGSGFLGGGFKGASRGIKEQAKVTVREGKGFIQNPIVRYGSKGAAIVFPPMVPVAAGVEAANQTIAAIEGKDPVKAAFALATVANSVAAAQGGDPDALRAVKTIKAVRDGAIPPKLGKAVTTMAKGISFAIPKGATKTQAITAAHKLLNVAKGSSSAKAQRAAVNVIKNTIAQAKRGDKKSKAGAAVLKAVHLAQKSLGSGHGRSSFKKAIRAVKGKRYTGSYLVDSRGNVVKGTFSAQ